MRTAIFLLLGILVIVLIGSFVPQQNTSDPTKVEAFLTAWPNLNVLFADLQLPLTQVFVSPVFYVLLGLLYVSLGWCVIRRGRALVMRTAARIQTHAAVLGRMGIVAVPQSFFLLLIAVVWGKATGYQGLVTLTQGQELHQHTGRLRHAAAGPALPRQLRAVHAAPQQIRGDLRGQRRGQQLRQQRDRARPRQEGRDQEHPRQRFPQRRRGQRVPAGLRLGADHRGQEPRGTDRVRRSHPVLRRREQHRQQGACRRSPQGP